MLALVFLAVRVLAQTPAPNVAKGPEGVWHGTLGAGAAQLRLVLTITKSSADAYTGKVDSVDQGATIPIDTLTVNGDNLRLELKSVNAVYEGTLNKERTEITGKFTQGGPPIPLVFKAGPPPQTDTKAAAAPAPKPLSPPLEIFVPVAPAAFKAAGKTHLVYELHITNFARSEGMLLRLEVLGGNGQSLARYEGGELTALLTRVGVAPDAEKAKIGGGQRNIAYLWLTLGAGVAVPTTLEHRLNVKFAALADELELTGARVPVGQQAMTLSPPLRGGEWLAANGPSNTSGHRRALIPVNGRLFIAQRFAIDWVQKNPDGRTFSGDAKDNKNYRCYGAEALAVADAVVAAVKDGIPENIPGPASRAVPITLETIGGNYVILDLGQGRYAFYAHLQPGSLRVKVGDKVRHGQVLGLVGNSGNSTEPHLHFHLSNANSPLGSEGLPYVMPAFEVQGKGWGWKPAAGQTPEKRTLELPLENEVVRFPVR